MIELHATTICAVRRGPEDVAIGGDGQVTMGETAIIFHPTPVHRPQVQMNRPCNRQIGRAHV